jgi:hypothetical protein
MRKWHHGHSLGSGVLGGLLLSTHGWLVLALGLVAGWLARDLYSSMRWVAMALAARHARKRKPSYVPSWSRKDKVPY